MEFDEFGDAFFSEDEHAAEGVGSEWVGFGGALDFDKFSASGHNDVHVGLGGGIFFVIKVEHFHSADDTDGNCRHWFVHEVAFDHFAVEHPGDGLVAGDVGGGDGCRSGSAIGHEGVAVDSDGSLSHSFEINDGAEGAADETLDFHCAAVGAAPADVSLVALATGSREHGVFGGDPSGAGAFEPSGDIFFDGGGDVHVGVSHFDEAGAFGVFAESGFEGYGSELVVGSSVVAHMGRILPVGES